MSLLDIVYCYVTATIPFSGDFTRLRGSFRESGFREKQISETRWKYTRGAVLAFEFNYSSETTQMQIYLERPDQEHLSIKVGNWGFPFEPLLMKKRFQHNLRRIVNDISTYQELHVEKGEIKKIEKDAEKKNRYALIALAIFIIYYYEFVFWR